MRSGLLRGIDAEERSLQTGRINMAGMFEVFVDGDAHFRFRLKEPDGPVSQQGLLADALTVPVPVQHP
jgi:hypothetical protein